MAGGVPTLEETNVLSRVRKSAAYGRVWIETARARSAVTS
jgi:hypothetical protein